MIVARTLVFRAKLSRRTHTSLESFFEEMRHLWNAALEERIDAHRKARVSITWVDQFKALTEIRRALPEYSGVSVAAQRSVLKRLDRAFQSFFRRHAAGQKAGFPRFRSKHRSIRSFDVPAPNIHRQGRWNTVKVKGIGKFRFKGEVDGTPKILRIVKTPMRVTVQIVVEREAAEATDLRPPLGLDAGIRYRAALSDGHAVPGRRLDRTELKRRQRRLSKAKRGSKGRCKKRLALAREWQRVTERERGAMHELTARLVREHGARVYVEDLKIPNLLRNRRLARSIAEQNWGGFVSLLTYKAEEAGGWVRKVPPASHVAVVFRMRGIAGREADAGGAHLRVRVVRPRGRPRRECGEEHPFRGAGAPRAGRGFPRCAGRRKKSTVRVARAGIALRRGTVCEGRQ